MTDPDLEHCYVAITAAEAERSPSETAFEQRTGLSARAMLETRAKRPAGPGRHVIVPHASGLYALIEPLFDDEIRGLVYRVAHELTGISRWSLLGNGSDDRALADFAAGIALSTHVPGAPPREWGASEGMPRIDVAHSDTVPPAIAEGVTDGTVLNWCRALVDLPPSQKPPARFCDLVVPVAEALGVGVEIVAGAKLGAQGFGGLSAVGRAGSEPPCLLRLNYGDKGPHIGLLGKGVTFDTGGINLKRSAGILARMKEDMGGAAAAIAATLRAAELGLPVRITCLAGLAENGIGPEAIKPGDVVTHVNGLTTEITDTDSEGRLILADLLGFADGLGLEAIVDLATLTSAFLGPGMWGVMASDDALAAALIESGRRVGDPGWRLPVLPELMRHWTSPVADTTNHSVATEWSETVAAGAYLARMAPNTPWAHMDIAGTATSEYEFMHDWPLGATGSPTLVLLDWLKGLARAKIARA